MAELDDQPPVKVETLTRHAVVLGLARAASLIAGATSLAYFIVLWAKPSTSNLERAAWVLLAVGLVFSVTEDLLKRRWRRDLEGR